ncbi:MAG: amino-acid N-acetyltransferase [Pseudomonadales bacterium]|nr:amino-acid N-acetyltransferase [Pseudomonadales bacterium]
MSDNAPYVKWFRESTPYINAHRGRTFVLHVSGEALLSDNLTNIIGDMVLLNSLGVRLVVVFGATVQIDQHLDALGIETRFVDGVRVTTAESLPGIQQAIGKIRSDIESRLSLGLVNSPQHGAEIVVTSGNFIRAKPYGVRDGVDFQHTGEVRKVHAKAIAGQLAAGAIVLVSSLGYSPSGEIFNVNSVEVASEVAAALIADKLIYLIDEEGLLDADGNLLTEMPMSEVPDDVDRLSPAAQAKRAAQRGVSRCHLITFNRDGALLEELFTRDGAGTQISRTSYEQIRSATSEDVAGIIELIAPLEAQGILVKRPRELLEAEIEHFIVIVRDGMIISCAALYPFGDKGELACLATHPDYRDGDRGEALLAAIEARAKSLKMTSLFALTTHTAHWFTERGFRQIDVDALPEKRRNLYNWQRNSKLFEKPLA